MTGVAVIVPWRPVADRQTVWDWLRTNLWGNRYQGWTVVEGQPPAGPWCKAAAVADALTRTDAETLVVADADVWCTDVAEAVGAVLDGAPWAIPHRMVYRLKPAPTAAAIAGNEPPTLGPLIRKPYVGWAGGGIVAIPRATYEQVPLDHRFTGWGQEDASWAIALNTMVGQPWRGTAPLIHLWHEEQPREEGEYGSQHSRWLYQQYQNAGGRIDAMSALLDGAGGTDGQVPIQPVD